MTSRPELVPERQRPVATAVFGAGMFGTGVVTQSSGLPDVNVCVVADAAPGSARRAFLEAGVPNERIADCGSRRTALSALEAGMCVVLEDALLAMDLPLDVVVESTGVPEAGARHALEAIRHGKHVVMVNKEADAVVGPILKQRADRQGVAYLPADGDQHGLLIALVAWARRIGLEVVCGGKARVGELILEEDKEGLSVGGIRLGRRDEDFFRLLRPREAADLVARRRDALGARLANDPDSMEEAAITANATGLMPDRPELHCAVVRTREIPEALSCRPDGGILDRTGAVELITCLRRPDEAGLGGGVFLVVACENAYSRRFVMGKSHTTNAAGTTALILRPYHLCGVETPTSILAAAANGVSASPADYRPRVDVVARAKVRLSCGGRVDAADVAPEVHASRPLGPGNALPYRMAVGSRLVGDVPAGGIVTAERIEQPADPILWQLRAEQDRMAGMMESTP